AGERVEAVAGVGADRGDRHAGRGRRELGERVGELARVDEVDLADDDDRRRAAVPRGGEIALEAAGAGVAVGRGGGQEAADVGGDDLLRVAAAGGAADELRAPRQDVVDHGGFVAGGRGDRDPVADGGQLGGGDAVAQPAARLCEAHRAGGAAACR